MRNEKKRKKRKATKRKQKEKVAQKRATVNQLNF
jgi:hypothetical protein